MFLVRYTRAKHYHVDIRSTIQKFLKGRINGSPYCGNNSMNARCPAFVHDLLVLYVELSDFLVTLFDNLFCCYALISLCKSDRGH
jgi:hypothetical protein